MYLIYSGPVKETNICLVLFLLKMRPWEVMHFLECQGSP